MPIDKMLRRRPHWAKWPVCTRSMGASHSGGGARMAQNYPSASSPECVSNGRFTILMLLLPLLSRPPPSPTPPTRKQRVAC